MKKIVGFLLITLTIIISACHSQPSYDSRLLLADSIMQHRHDSALALLRNLNASDLSSEADVALHALLLSQAYDKNYIDLTNDSLISIAVDYFSEGNEPRYAMLAHYYHACVLFNAQKYSDCVLACMKAELSAKQISDDFYLGMIYRHLLFVHNATYNFSEALSYAQKSYTHFKASGKELYSRWALKDLAVSYHNNSQCSKSLELFYEVIKIAHQSQDSVFLSDALSLYTVILGQAKKYDDALSIVDSLYASAQPKTSFEYSSFSFIYAKCGDVAKAGMCLTKSCDLASTLNDSLSIEYAWRQLARVSKDSVEYYKHQYKIANFRNKQYTDSTKIAIAAAQRNAQTSQFNAKIKQTEQRVYILYIIATILILFIVMCICVIYKRKKDATRLNIFFQQQLAKYNQNINELKIKLDTKETSQEKYQDEQNRLQLELDLLKEVSQFGGQARKYADNIVKSANITSKFGNISSDLTGSITEDDWDELNKLVMSQYPKFKITLLSSTLTDSDIKFCLMSKIGLSPTKISIITHRAKSSVSSSKKRIYKKITGEEGSARNFDELIRSL